MDDATCPACKETIGEIVEREVTADGVQVSFECGSCGHLWEVVF